MLKIGEVTRKSLENLLLPFEEYCSAIVYLLALVMTAIGARKQKVS